MDLGTNMFHLLIVEGDRTIVHQQDAVKLGEGGINKGFITAAACGRGIQTMQRFSELIRQNDVSQARAIATSGLRNASNGQDFINDVKEKTGIAIEIIDGDREAAFIYEGIKAAGCLTERNSLIVDIGGGSAECIICNNREIFWKQSFEIGAARLMDKFHRSDPIPPDSINALVLYLEDCLQNLFAAAKKNPVENLVGSAGVFESYAVVLEKAKGHILNLDETKQYNFNQAELLSLIEKIILSTHQQRIETAGIIPIRIDMIVTASLLARFIIEKLDIKDVVMSTYSLKEGVLAEMTGFSGASLK